MKDVDDKLFTIEETICDELARAKSGSFVGLKISMQARRAGSNCANTAELFQTFSPREFTDLPFAHHFGEDNTIMFELS